MMEKKTAACPVELTLQFIGNKWSMLILRDLSNGTKRFGELKKSVGNITQKVLTANLRTMEANGLIGRRVYAEVPPRVEYSLTDVGRSLYPVLREIKLWGLNYQRDVYGLDITDCVYRPSQDCRASGLPVAKYSDDAKAGFEHC